MHLGWSSQVYPLDARDVARASDWEGPEMPAADLPSDPVILLIRPDGPDALIRGRSVVEAAGDGTVDVRVVFLPSVAKWNLPFMLLRFLRDRRRFKGSGVYHIAPEALRRLGVERAVRTLENPQQRRNCDRSEKMRSLEDSLRRNGYDDGKPVIVMLCRMRGVGDSLRQGHHRISACIAVGIPKIALRFSAAGTLPRCLRRFVGRPPMRLDVFKTALEAYSRKPVRRIVPLGDDPFPKSVIVVPEAGGRYTLDLRGKITTVGIASALMVPALVGCAFAFDVLVLRTACGDHSFVAWCQVAITSLCTVLASVLAAGERRARAGYAALAVTFAFTAGYELLSDVFPVASRFVVGRIAFGFTATYVAGAFLFARDTFERGVRRIRASRAFAALPFGCAVIWVVSELVSIAGIWRSFGLSEIEVKTVKRALEEGTELLGYAAIGAWMISFFRERVRTWRWRT